jgi:hypothetical protein
MWRLLTHSKKRRCTGNPHGLALGMFGTQLAFLFEQKQGNHTRNLTEDTGPPTRLPARDDGTDAAEDGASVYAQGCLLMG